MSIVTNIVEFLFPPYAPEYEAPVVSQGDNTLVYTYAQKYIDALSPFLTYDVFETLKSGRVITHLKGVTHKEAKEYVARIWIIASPPNISVKVTPAT